MCGLLGCLVVGMLGIKGDAVLLENNERRKCMDRLELHRRYVNYSSGASFSVLLVSVENNHSVVRSKALVSSRGIIAIVFCAF